MSDSSYSSYSEGQIVEKQKETVRKPPGKVVLPEALAQNRESTGSSYSSYTDYSSDASLQLKDAPMAGGPGPQYTQPLYQHNDETPKPTVAEQYQPATQNIAERETYDKRELNEESYSSYSSYSDSQSSYDLSEEQKRGSTKYYEDQHVGTVSNEEYEELMDGYRRKLYDIPPYAPNGPMILLIIDSNFSQDDPVYKASFEQIKKINDRVQAGKTPEDYRTIIFACNQEDDMFNYCTKNMRVLRTYNGHCPRLRFVTNSNRAFANPARKSGPEKAGDNFVRYVRVSLRLTDAPILVFYFKNTACEALRNEEGHVFVTNNPEEAYNYIAFCKMPYKLL